MSIKCADRSGRMMIVHCTDTKHTAQHCKKSHSSDVSRKIKQFLDLNSFVWSIHAPTFFIISKEWFYIHIFFFYPTTSSYTCKCATQANFLCVHFHYEEFSSASSIHSTTRWDLTKIDWQCACIDSAITTITWANFLSCVLPWPLYFSRCMCTMHIIWLVCMSTCTLPVQCSVCMSG